LELHCCDGCVNGLVDKIDAFLDEKEKA